MIQKGTGFSCDIKKGLQKQLLRKPYLFSLIPVLFYHFVDVYLQVTIYANLNCLFKRNNH